MHSSTTRFRSSRKIKSRSLSAAASCAFVLPLHLHLFHAIDERLELAAARRMTQLAQCLGFDLPDAFAGDLEALSYFFQRMLGSIFKAKAHLDHSLFARSQRAKHL